MAYRAIEPADLMRAVLDLRYMPKMLEYITGVEPSPIYDEVFSKDRKMEKTTRYFDQSSTKTISVVTYRGVEGTFEPINSKVITAASFEPKAIKVMKSYTPTFLDELGRVQMKTATEVFREDYVDFMLTRDANIKNQCAQFFAGTGGTINFPERNADGTIVTGDSINYQTYFGTITALTVADTSYVVNWGTSTTTQDDVWNSVKQLIKYGRVQSSYKHFKKVSDIIIFAQDAAFAYLHTMSPNEYMEKVLTQDGFDYKIGNGTNTVRIINTNMPYQTWTYDATTDKKWELTSADALASGEIVVLDNAKGNFKIRDLKYLTTSNAGKDIPFPYSITTEKLPHETGIELAFGCYPLVIGNPLAMFKAKVIS